MNIRELRKQVGMKQKEFADFLGIPARTLQNWEVGIRSCPDYIERMISEKVQEYIERTVPVPMDKLREIPAEPVWVRSKDLNGWRFVHGIREHEAGGEVLLLIDRAGRVADFLASEYGGTWSAYLRKPAEV